jgi:hypothetical protein
VAGIGNPRQCRCDIDRADGGCHTWRAPVPCRARVGLDTGVNLAVCAGVGPVSSAVGKTFFYRIQTPASPLPEAGRAGCVCTRPSGSFRRIRYRPSVPTPVITKQLRRSDPLHASDRRRHLMSDSGRRSQYERGQHQVVSERRYAPAYLQAQRLHNYTCRSSMVGG